MNKKAGLDVSVNSIVVIVFALIMLGLGIAFINGLFGKIEVPIPKPTVHANAEQPIVLYRDTITLKRGDRAKLPITYYNNEIAVANKVLPRLTDCIDEAGDHVISYEDGTKYSDNSGKREDGTAYNPVNDSLRKLAPNPWRNYFTLVAMPRTVAVGDEFSFEATLTVGTNVPKGLYSCSLIISNTEKQFAIEIG